MMTHDVFNDCDAALSTYVQVVFFFFRNNPEVRGRRKRSPPFSLVPKNVHEGDEHFVASRRYALDGEWPYSRYSFQSTWYLGRFCVSIGIPVSACVYRPVMFATHDGVDRSFLGYAMVYMACGKSESQ